MSLWPQGGRWEVLKEGWWPKAMGYEGGRLAQGKSTRFFLINKINVILLIYNILNDTHINVSL